MIGGWWLATEEPLVYYCVDLFEQATLQWASDAGARITIRDGAIEIKCRHGDTASDEALGASDCIPCLVRLHEDRFSCRCAMFLRERYLHESVATRVPAEGRLE